MQWKEIDAVNGMKFSVLLHLQYSLKMEDNEGSSLIFQEFLDYMRNLSQPPKAVNLAAGVTTAILKATINHWKNMQKSVRHQQSKTYFNEKDSGHLNSNLNADVLDFHSTTVLQPVMESVHSAKIQAFLNQ